MKALHSTTLTERHFSASTLAELWGLDSDTIRKRFANEPGVIKYGKPGGRGRKPHITLRIPESVALRVYSDLTR